MTESATSVLEQILKSGHTTFAIERIGAYDKESTCRDTALGLKMYLEQALPKEVTSTTVCTYVDRP